MEQNKISQIIISFLILASITFALYFPEVDASAQIPTLKIPTIPATLIPTAMPTVKTPTGIPTINITNVPTFQLSSCDSWKIEIDLTMAPAEVSQLGGVASAASQLQNTIANSLPFQSPIKTSVTSKENSGGGATYFITVEGTGLGLLRQTLFVSLKKTLDILGFPIEMVISGNVEKGDKIEFLLSLIASTGKKWFIDGMDDAARLDSSIIECSHVAPGTIQNQTLIIEALKTGELALKLIYGRIWEKIKTNPPVRITLHLCDMPKNLNMSNPASPSVSADAPQGSLQTLGADGLPSSYDWSTSNNRAGANMLTGVRDQASCGSCWSFASVGVLESLIKIGGGGDTDLSEQYLINCNNDGWSCNGGWWAHDYHINKQGKQNNPPGAVAESSVPYQAKNGTCTLINNHPYKLQSWTYVGDETMESVPSIKAAIYNNGPVAAAVCASDSFSSYKGGIYEKHECGNVNHAIMLVGWDDSSQTWKLRNSWGSGWGEGGYMRIKWTVNAVGTSANYAVYGGGINLPTATTNPSNPTATITQTSQPTPTSTEPGQPEQTATKEPPAPEPVNPTSTPQTPVPGPVEPTATSQKPTQENPTAVPLPPIPDIPSIVPSRIPNPPQPGPNTTPTGQPPSPGSTQTPQPSGLGPGSYDDNEPMIVYEGNWHLFNGDGPVGGTAHYSNEIGNSFSFAFNGTQITLGYTAHPSRGVMLVWIDDKIFTIFNEFSWKLNWQRQWSSPIFESGNHVITVQHGTGTQNDLDFVIIE